MNKNCDDIKIHFNFHINQRDFCNTSSDSSYDDSLDRNKDEIINVIKSRKYESVAGPDVIDYSIFKLVPNAAANFIVAINDININSNRVPRGWKTSHTRLIYKKGDPSTPNNWEPISFSNAIYRIFSCLWARGINFFKKRLNVFSPNQRGFFAGINGCSDNASIVSELYCDAIRKNKDIIITALDFKNAFGSVPHEMIFSSLIMKGFPEKLH